MRYLLDDDGYYLGTVTIGSGGVEISDELPSYTNIQTVKWDGTEWIVEDSEKLRLSQIEYDGQEYARNRAFAYPSTGDQLDMMYKDTKNSTTTHADAVEAVKTKWPKDNSGPV